MNMVEYTLTNIIHLPGWPQTRQKSRFDDGNSDLAVDNDNTTCSETGRDMHPWWELQLDPAVNHTISSVHIKGTAGEIQGRDPELIYDPLRDNSKELNY